MSFRVFEMRRDNKEIPSAEISCIPFDKRYLEQYRTGYNAAFRPMREALDIRPYDWYHDCKDILDKSSDIFILIEGEELIGSVACYGNEIDDLFVSGPFRHQGYGRLLLVWAMNRITSCGYGEMIIHVAEWNENAVKMYMNEGFIISKTEDISV